MRTRLRLAAVLLCLARPTLAAPPPTVFRLPGSADRPLLPESLLGPGRSDVRLEDAQGNVTVYHGMPLLEVLEKNGVETRTMASQRKLAPSVVLAVARDGYTVVFSVGELLMHRADPRVFLVAETAAGPLPENEAPVRLIVYGDRARSPYGLARIELKALADNASARKP